MMAEVELRFRAAQHSGEAGHRGDDAADQQPHGFIGRISREKAGEAGSGGIIGTDAVDDEDDSADE